MSNVECPISKARERRRENGKVKIDGSIKSRHPDENRGPEVLQVVEDTGFRLPAFAGKGFIQPE
jgi:hypothetical protein